jgi:hypothetical protein
MSAKDWQALGRAIDRLRSLKQYLNIATAVVFVVALSFAYCSGRNAGRDEDRIKSIQANVELHKKAAELNKSQDAKEKKRGDSFEKKSAAVLTKYVTLRDTLVLTDTVQVKEVITLADSTIEAKDSVIASQKRRIGFLEIALSEKDEQIAALNRGMATRVRQIKSARHKGWIEGASVTAFAGFLLQASK